MAEDKKIPLAEQEAAMADAPGYGTAMLAVAVVLLTVVVLFAVIYLLMAAIRPIEPREGKSPRARPAVESPSPAPAPPKAPTAPLQTVPLPSPPPPR